MVHALIRRLARTEDTGSATIEVAILTPLLLLLLLGAADFARIYQAQMAVVGAAQAGAQYGSRSKLTAGDITGMTEAANRDAADPGAIAVAARRYCQCGGASASCTAVCSNGRTPEVFVEVTVTTTFSTALRYPGIPTDVPLRQTTTMRVE